MVTNLADLPEDVLTIIFSFCQARDFLAACCTCKTLYAYRQDALFWRTLTSTTFRLPVSPLLKADGTRWYYLYKRLKTQTKLYTWGQGLNGNLGPGRTPFIRPPRGRILRSGIGRRPFQRASSSWPTETHVPAEVTVIADLQCGGWSTTILSSDGNLYVTGIVDAMDGRFVGESTEEFRKLEYLTQSTSAIRQFSSGRRHILALTDDHEILSWDRINAKGLKVFSRNGHNFGGITSRVVAGWGASSAYVPEVGIVYWEPIKNDTQDEMLDGLHVADVTVPGTARQSADGGPIMEVISHVVLENFIVWINSASELWACDTHVMNKEQTAPSRRPFQVPGYSSSARLLQDIQGQYNKFAVFTTTGEVLAGDIEYLRHCADAVDVAERSIVSDDVEASALPSSWANLDQILPLKPRDIAGLQHNQVISLAFGDHHYHALHANGKITSYGKDPQSTGALGLGSLENGARFRGLRKPAQAIRTDASLLEKAESRGRNIWFEPEKRDWLYWMEDTLREDSSLGDVTDQEGRSVGPLYLWTFDANKQLMFSEWVEQEGKHWDDGPAGLPTENDSESKIPHKQDDFHLDPYFTIAIAAAGWHSGALVLVDEDKAHDTRQKWLTSISHSNHTEASEGEERQRLMPGHFETEPAEPEEIYTWKIYGFPKIVLPDGYEMPGKGEPRPWREGKPTLAELGLET